MRLISKGGTRPSFRALAQAAEVSVPTLRHYFGSRDEAIQAVFEDMARQGETHVRAAAVPSGPFAESVREALGYAALGLRRTVLGNLLAAGMSEGLLHARLGPAYVKELLEPTLQALAARLEAHQQRGEMIPGDTRAAALILFAPLFLACQHQDQLGGAKAHPLDVDGFLDSHARAFARAFATDSTPASGTP